MSDVELFLEALARGWAGPERPKLKILGSTALFLRTNYARGTKDSDVLETTELDASMQQRLLALGGPKSKLASQWRLHLQIVRNGVPFLPRVPVWHEVMLPDAPATLSFAALDVVDVCVSKLKRLHADDKNDIAAMIERGLVDHAVLLERFRSAVDGFLGDAREAELPRYIRRLNEVERDLYGVEESEIELPDYLL